MSSRCMLVIGELGIAQANALSDGVFLSAVPPLTAWVGLATALNLRLGADISINGIAPVIGEAQLHRGHAKYVRYRSGQLSDVSSRGVQHPTIDDRRTSLNAYLMLDVSYSDTLELDLISQALIGLRLAGGVIQPLSGHRDITIKEFQHDGQNTALAQALQRLPSYFYLLEDASRLVEAAQQQTDGPQGFAILTACMQRWAGDETPEERKKQLTLPERPEWLPERGYYRPMAVGYQLLEAAKHRSGARDNLLHAFAEPVFSLIRFRSVASVRKNHNPRNDGSYVWRQGERSTHIYGACAVNLNKKAKL